MTTIKQTIIEQLESDEWESISPRLVNIGLARNIRSGVVSTRKPKPTVIARIQCLLVESGKYTDSTFVDDLRIVP